MKWFAAVVVLLWVDTTAGRISSAWAQPDDLRLWTSAYAIDPQNTRARLNIAVAMARRGFTDVAQQEYLRIAAHVDDPDPAKAVAEENYRRSHITEAEFQAWFQGDAFALSIPRSHFAR